MPALGDAGPEHLGPRAEARALARSGVQTGAELAQILPREHVRIGVAAGLAAQALVGSCNSNATTLR